MKTIVRHAFVACVGVMAAACAVDPSAPSGAMKIYETCLRTQCDSMTSKDNSQCSACESACFSASYSCNASSECSSSCSPTECSDYDRNTCEQQGFKVTLPNNPSQEVADACERELSHVADCGYTTQTTSSDCTRWAATEPAERASNYDCVAQLACDSLTAADAIASCDVPPSSFGDEICDPLAQACPGHACASTTRDALDADGAWVRPDALDAARSCLSQPSCDETRQCLEAWESAVE